MSFVFGQEFKLYLVYIKFKVLQRVVNDRIANIINMISVRFYPVT